MDPNATLAEIRALIRAFFAADDENRMTDIGGELAEKIEALDRWLEGGGFLPDAWRYKTSARVG